MKFMFVILKAVTLALVTCIGKCQPDVQISNLSLADSETVRLDSSTCYFNLSMNSARYFRNVLSSAKPDVIHFTIYINSLSHRYPATPDTFQPDKWVWTYKSRKGLHPFLHWNIDYSVLSFGLLDAKTFINNDMYVLLQASSSCNITFGTPETTLAIGRALRDMILIVHEDNPGYEESYFCYLAEANISHERIAYQAAVYLMYPIAYINYNCCKTYYNASLDDLTVSCGIQVEKWIQCLLWPYILCIIIFTYSPIWVFEIASWVSDDESIKSPETELMDLNFETFDPNQGNEDDWIFLNGKTPYTFKDLLKSTWCGLNKVFPTLISRIRRLLFLIFLPAGVYVKLVVYYVTMLDVTKLLIKHHIPVGFLSLLGESQYRNNAFATVLGGPKGLFIIFFTSGTLLLVVPRSVKQIIENGVPKQNDRFLKSPLFLSAERVKQLSMVNHSLEEPGYKKAITLFKCGLYLLFCTQFWKLVISMQVERISIIQTSSSKFTFVLKLLVMPVYLILCLIEVVLCIVLYGCPICMFMLIFLLGVRRSLISFRSALTNNFSSTSWTLIVNNPVTRVFGFLCAVVMILLFWYTLSLIFIDTFTFVSKIIVFCFVAVIVYPSVSFGYLFFFIVLTYHTFRKVRDFGDGYLTLLSEAVEISRHMDQQPNHVSFFREKMIVANVVSPPGITVLQINNISMGLPPNVLRSILNNHDDRPKVKVVKNLYGIPRKLFTFLIIKHRPVHYQVLKIALNIALITTLIALTISITSKDVTGPSSKISAVMHVVFIIAVGALPQVLKMFIFNSNTSVKREIELRRLEQSIVEFWNDTSTDLNGV